MSMETPDSWAYVGREQCGHITCATVDLPEHRSQVANELAKWHRWGLTIERMTVEQARADMWLGHGPHCTEQQETTT